MTVADPRVLPIVAVNRATVDAIFAALGRAPVREITLAHGGLVNTVYRVTTSADESYALRLYADSDDRRAADARLTREMRLLSWLARAAGDVPVPRLSVADGSRTQLPTPYVVYPWIDGITLNDCRRQYGAAALTSLAEPLGRLLARISAVGIGDDVMAPPLGEPTSTASALGDADARLASSPARDRLGSIVADAMRATLDAERAALLELDRHRSLVHGDFGGRNVIVRLTDEGTWDVGGILDWEAATIASPMWDVGSLFRYAPRYSADFRASFAHGYRAGGGRLPDEWWRLSRLVDVTRVVRILSEERELPSVFDDCRDIVAGLVDDCTV